MKALLAAIALSGASLVAMADDVKIGYVNTEKISREADAAKKAAQRLETEFKKREKDLSDAFNKLRADADRLDKDAPTLSEAEKTRRQKEILEANRDLERRKREYQEDLTQRRNEELASVAERMNRAVKQIFETEHYDLILSDQAAAYLASARIDITKKVIDAMNAQK
jgi:outer membrane protein